MDKGVCIQIGLDRDLEMYYLLDDPTTRSYMRNHYRLADNFYIPEPLQYIKDWRLYAVDSDVASIDYLRRKFRDPRISFICASIGDGRQRLAKYSGEIAHAPYNVDWHAPANYSAVLTVPELIEALGFAHVNVLAIDVDGSEYEIFSDFQTWQVFPDFLIVEFHHPVGKQKGIVDKILDVGYDYYGDNTTVSGLNQFVRRKVCNNRTS